MTHYGKCIDDKTPLLRSCDAVKAQGVSLGLLSLRSRWWSRAVMACAKVSLFNPPQGMSAPPTDSFLLMGPLWIMGPNCLNLDFLLSL